MRHLLRGAVSTAVIVSSLMITSHAAYAANPHFVKTPTVSRSDNTITVSGKEDGLGNEETIKLALTGTALCINPGNQHPKAVNKLQTSQDFPVQNGSVDFSLSATATFQPDCSPPMTVVFTDISVTDETNGISALVLGVF